MTRGIRNNNPLNIRRGSLWKGMCLIQRDKQFVQFKDMVHGVRAALYLLSVYRSKYGITNIEDIITRWAPPSDGNNTKRYISIVKKNSYLKLCDYIEDDFDLFVLVSEMSLVESGFSLTPVIYHSAFALLPNKFRQLWTSKNNTL